MCSKNQEAYHVDLRSFTVFHLIRPKANRPGMRTLFVPRIGNVMGLVFGLRDVLIYSKTYLIPTYKDEWLFDAIEQIKVGYSSWNSFLLTHHVLNYFKLSSRNALCFICLTYWQ